MGSFGLCVRPSGFGGSPPPLTAKPRPRTPADLVNPSTLHHPLTTPPPPPPSAHYCRDPLLAAAVGRFLEREAQQVWFLWLRVCMCACACVVWLALYVCAHTRKTGTPPTHAHTTRTSYAAAHRPPPTAPPQVNYTWQQLTLEASPYKKERTLAYVMDKAASFSSLSSGSGLDSLSVDGGA